MSSLRKLTLSTFIFSLLISPEAIGGLYGFTSVNPYTKEERILHQESAPERIINYRNKMRENVLMLANFAKEQRPDFEIMTHDDGELLQKNLWEHHLDGYNEARRTNLKAQDPTFLSKKSDPLPKSTQDEKTIRKYNHAVDALVYNNYFCSNKGEKPKNGKKLISIDHCPNEDSLNAAIQDSVGSHTLLYAFTDETHAFKDTENQIIINENARNTDNIKDASNIVFILDTSRYKNKESLIEDIRNSNFDITVIPPNFRGKEFDANEVYSMKFKKNGTTRKIIAALNVSEGDPSEYYWQSNWKIGNPTWLRRPSFVEKDNIITEYWHPQWQEILSHYFKIIVDMGFDGAFLTGLENYRYFEQQTPLE